MSRCYKCGKELTSSGDVNGLCLECQTKEWNIETHPAEVGEALELLKEMQEELNKNWGNKYKSWWNIRCNKTIQTLTAQSRELAEKDIKIKRYIELNNKSITLDCEYDEFERLEKELSSNGQNAKNR